MSEISSVRELHKRGDRCTCCSGFHMDGTPSVGYLCTECGPHWPCATAKLVYTSEELS